MSFATDTVVARKKEQQPRRTAALYIILSYLVSWIV